ncbi:MAG: NAD(+)/NADH kinase [Helicobacter sp.]|uniref:NAD(+)/NADH kinase n=1 Tax=Helicobacter sp. 10-6591 TaxID=2004998 RepID=UPI000DCC0C3C|nr:NAD(+)/NADH kinase [Helicobacter sp. 10-6591]MCI6217743.1 NAD(+)/NADH kinase [Helicobacter sp.]MCI7485688.1 NAD(+)/NADH kinase [Helicobacter sp.]RAX52497.1 NAD(+) kinase [Helicobacter sp. 10-6591]
MTPVLQPKKITKIGVVLRPSTPNLKSVFEQIQALLKSYEIEVKLDSISAAMIGFRGVEFATLTQWSDILLSIGGDGTLISMIRRATGKNIACMGINTGRLGFLTAIMPSELQCFALNLKNGTYDIKNHMMLECTLLRDNKPYCTLYALNEFLISKQNLSGLIDIEAKIDNWNFNTYFCDALIVGTPTGSTAYNISAGGSVVYPYSKNILLTPVAPHSLTQRPLVIDNSIKLEFSTKESALLIIDGQENIDIYPRDRILIQESKDCAYLIYPKERNYFQILREKFKWGEL